MELRTKLIPKQMQAMQYINDKTTTILTYGGAAGGGKSYLICVALRDLCLVHEGSRRLLGRARMKSLKESTLLTLFQVFAEANMKEGTHYKYNSISGVISISNGSSIYLKDLFHYPSDPHFDSLGSTEYCGAFIDEGGQIDKMAFDTVRSRLRYKMKEFGIVPKIIVATNPCKNFIYQFYKMHRDDELPDHIKFIKALPTDNHHLPKEYLKLLLQLDKIQRERLYYGNREYDDNPLALIDYDSITDLWSNVIEGSDDHCIVADVARMGKDLTTVYVWRGWDLIEIKVLKISTTQDTIQLIESMRSKYKVSKSRTVVDEDGVGGGVVDIGEYVGFQGGSRAIDGNYQNLRAECIYKVSTKIVAREVRISVDTYREQTTEELEQRQAKDIDKDGKLKVVGKDIIKQKIGRSPDYTDPIMMRMLLDLEKEDEMFFDEVYDPMLI